MEVLNPPQKRIPISANISPPPRLVLNIIRREKSTPIPLSPSLSFVRRSGVAIRLLSILSVGGCYNTAIQYSRYFYEIVSMAHCPRSLFGKNISDFFQIKKMLAPFEASIFINYT